MNSIIKKFYSLIIISVFLTITCFAQEGNSPFSIFKDVMSKKWVGHYIDSEHSNLKHEKTWDFMLKGAAVREVKKVNELSFEMETYVFKNKNETELGFLSLDSKGNLSKGIVFAEENKIIYKGTFFHESGKTLFKQIFEILPDGTLSDTYLRERDGEWGKGHLIIYK